jgi:deazaflavin-dependent oxidoreductase (nitroreductase family)
MIRTCLRHPLRCVALAILALFSGIALSVRFQFQRPLGWVRRSNKHGLNRLTTDWAGRPGSPLVLVYHQGRSSGTSYRTPVIAAVSGEHLYIALTYGPRTDWCLNLMAAGSGHILRDGVKDKISAPEVVDASVALPSFALPVRIGCRLIGIRQFLKVAVAGREHF